MKKNILLFLAALLLTMQGGAQTINVHKTDGSVVEYQSNEVDFIDFAPTSNMLPDDLEAVDLGLPSGVKWANMNLGASKPEDYGLYFAWGETVGYGPSDGHSFDKQTYKWWDVVDNKMIKYGKEYDKWKLDLEDDAAHVLWGGNWEMPTYSEMNELLKYTTHELTSQNSVYGYKFTSKKNGKSIFLPTADIRVELEYGAAAFDFGVYFTSTLSPTEWSDPYSLQLYDKDFIIVDSGSNWVGCSIRPIKR